MDFRTTAITFLSVALVAGCTVRYVSPAEQCQQNPARLDCHEDFMRMKSFTSDGSEFGAMASLFDASLATANLASSNVSLAVAPTSATIQLKNNNSTIATATFSVNVSNDVIYFSNPSVVNSWISENAYNANDATVYFDTTSFNKQPGTNVVTLEWEYDGDLLSGSSWSTYVSSGNGPGENQEN